MSTELSVHTKAFKAELKVQIAKDLDELLSQYNNRDIGIRIIGEKTNIGEKTLKRIIGQESIPHTNTVRGFYSYFLKINPGESEIHQKIQKLIAKESISTLLSSYDQESDSDLAQLLVENKVLREIYLYSRTGHITQAWVKNEYGKYGMEIVQFMLDQNILLEIEKNIYVQGAINISKTSAGLKKILEELVVEHLDKEKLEMHGQSSAYYMVEGISENAKSMILDKMEECKGNIAKIMFDKSNRGCQRVFVLSVLDELKFDNDDISLH